MRTRSMMAGFVALMGLVALPVQGQEGRWDEDRWEDFAERMSAVLEEAMERAGWATQRALEEAGRATERALRAVDEVDWDAQFRDLEKLAAELESLEGMEIRWDDEGWRDEGGHQSTEEFRWTGRVDAGDVLEIKGVNGRISARPAAGEEIEVVAMKKGRRSDPAEVRIEVIEHSGGVTLCAVYPTPRGERENACGVGEDGRNSTERNDVQVDWEVRVPDEARFRGRTVNGDVEAVDLGSDVDVATVNGDVEVTTEGVAEARTVNGSIRARMDGVLSSDVSFETVNGSIELDVDQDLDADLDASWLNGDLETELPFQVQGRVGRRSAEGLFGDGGPELRLRTVNGSIRIY
jgi:hypothetical protein